MSPACLSPAQTLPGAGASAARDSPERLGLLADLQAQRRAREDDGDGLADVEEGAPSARTG